MPKLKLGGKSALKFKMGVENHHMNNPSKGGDEILGIVRLSTYAVMVWFLYYSFVILLVITCSESFDTNFTLE